MSRVKATLTVHTARFELDGEARHVSAMLLPERDYQLEFGRGKKVHRIRLSPPAVMALARVIQLASLDHPSVKRL